MLLLLLLLSTNQNHHRWEPNRIATITENISVYPHENQ